MTQKLQGRYTEIGTIISGAVTGVTGVMCGACLISGDYKTAVFTGTTAVLSGILTYYSQQNHDLFNEVCQRVDELQEEVAELKERVKINELEKEAGN